MDNHRCYVGSEVGQLNRVILHHPELSLERLTPSNCEMFLFDDVLRVSQAGKEHAVFAQLLRDEEVEVFLLRNLLAETLEIPEAQDWILRRQCSPYFLGTVLAEEAQAFLKSQSPIQMASYLLGGILSDELTGVDESLTKKLMHRTDFVIPPLPNHLFTRDTSCWIYNGVSINPMAKPARKRETVNLKAIYNFHPLFAKEKFEFWYGNHDHNYENATIEGGDVLVIGKGLVLIGMGERTSTQAVELISSALFAKDAAKKVVAIELPKARSSMHLDTVMTMLDVDCFTVFPPVIDNIKCWEISKGSNTAIRTTEIKENLFDYIARHLGTNKMRIIPTGGDIFQMEREQWNDANNVLTVRPGVVIGYERNVHTIEKMQAAGIHVLIIPGSELGRGRGGARCMSCPFDRDNI